MSQRKISKSDLNIVLQRLNDELKKKHPAHATIILEKQMGVGYGLMAVGHGYSAPFPTHAWPRSRRCTTPSFG
jgi:hypothetical protein